jgi:hypothetical protein
MIRRSAGPLALSLLALVLACAVRSQPGDGDTQPGDGDTQPADDDTGNDTTTVGGTETGDSNPDCQPILQDDGTPTGYEQCMSDDAVVRVGSATCSDPYPPSHEASCSAGYGVCSSNADCNDAPYGACGYPADITAVCDCNYGCMTDADCGPGRVCMCAPVDEGTLCIEAECQTDADCDPGYRCALSPGALWYGQRASQHCHSAADECLGDADCTDGLCLWHDERWECGW